MKRRTLMVLAAALLLAGCKSDQPTAGVYGGGWVAACVASGSDSYRRDLLMGRATFSETVVYYVGTTTCTGAADRTALQTGNYSRGAAVSATLATVTATREDIQLTARYLTLNDAATAATYSTDRAYGITSWALGVTESTLGSAYDGTAESADRKDLLYVDTSVTPNVLYLGDPATLAADGYPTALDSAAGLTRQ